VAFTIVAGIYALATVFYFPLVFLNLTWTHDGLPLANVLYYNAAGSNAQVARYAAQWWWVATDALRILVPGVAIGFVWYYSVYKTGTDLLEEAGVSTGLYIFVFTLITVVDLAKAGYYSYFWAFDCDGWQICRNDDPAGNANDANFSYVYMTSFTIGFTGLSLVLLLLEVAGKLITRASARANIMSSNGGGSGGGGGEIKGKMPPVNLFYTTSTSPMNGRGNFPVERIMIQNGSNKARPKTKGSQRRVKELDVEELF